MPKNQLLICLIITIMLNSSHLGILFISYSVIQFKPHPFTEHKTLTNITIATTISIPLVKHP